MVFDLRFAWRRWLAVKWCPPVSTEHPIPRLHSQPEYFTELSPHSHFFREPQFEIEFAYI
jgi:hypothetical protein